MRVVFDTCVLVPSFLRAVLLACVEAANVEFIVSPRILEEWARAAKTPLQRLEAEKALAHFRLKFAVKIRPDPISLLQFWLPDPDDIHVLALAVKQHADVISYIDWIGKLDRPCLRENYSFFGGPSETDPRNM